MTSINLPVLFLKRNEDRRLSAGHLWVYSNEVDISKSPLSGFAAGSLAVIQSAAGKTLGAGYVNPRSLICARLLTRRPRAAIDAGFFERRQIGRGKCRRQECRQRRFWHGQGTCLIEMTSRQRGNPARRFDVSLFPHVMALVTGCGSDGECAHRRLPCSAFRIMSSTADVKLYPLRVSAAANPASGDRHGLVLISKIHGSLSSSTRKSILA